MPDVSTSDSIIGLIRGKLISQHYLTHQLSIRDDWKSLGEGPCAAQIEVLFETVKPQLSKNKPTSKGSNEDAVRDQFLNRVFDILGLPWSPSVRQLGKEIDYALFPDQETLAKAQSLITEGQELEALKKSCGIVEAERWGKEFGEKPKKSDLSDPIFQIEFYLQNAHRSGGPRWGMLTNGHTWRLYCGDSDPLRHDYLEIELPTKPALFAQQERDAFKLLVYFFGGEALRNGGRLDKIYDEATRHAAAITAELRRQAFGAVELLASSIMRASPNTPPSLAYEAALIQLFRLLFILKAEADGLLERRALSDDIADRITKKTVIRLAGASGRARTSGTNSMTSSRQSRPNTTGTCLKASRRLPALLLTRLWTTSPPRVPFSRVSRYPIRPLPMRSTACCEFISRTGRTSSIPSAWITPRCGSAS